MTRFPRRLLTGGLLLAGAVALAGCDSNPSAAAQVGSTTITVSQLASAVQHAYANPHAAATLGSKVSYERSQLSRLITDALLQRAAGRYGITVTAGQVDRALASFAQQAGGMSALVAQAQQAGFTAADLRPLVTDQLIEQRLEAKLTASVAVPTSALRALYQQNIDSYDQVDAAHILVSSKALAERILAQVKRDPASFAALAKRYSTDKASAAHGGNLGFAGRGAYVPAFANAIFSHPVGSYFIVHSQYGWHVVHVIAHRVTTFAQAEPSLRAQYLSTRSGKLLQQLLTTEARRQGVHVNPRFGSFNYSTGSVVAAPDPVSRAAT